MPVGLPSSGVSISSCAAQTGMRRLVGFQKLVARAIRAVPALYARFFAYLGPLSICASLVQTNDPPKLA